MSVLEAIQERAKGLGKTIVLPEGTEKRVVDAAVKITKEGIAKVVLLGDADEIKKVADGQDLSGIDIIDPVDSPKVDEYTKELVEIRKSKGMTEEQVRELLKHPLYYGVMMVKMGDADGMTAGSVYSTSDVLRPALQIIKAAPGVPIVSSCFVMDVPNRQYGENGAFIFADCGLNPNPNSDQLAAIAVTSAFTGKALVGMEPKVALLSFSTKGSAKHELIDKVTDALKAAKEMAPELLIDGELQLDAAIVPGVAETKCPDSPIKGQANVLVFPDLQAGNIAYKIVQRLANAEAIGPICQGLAKPINDLSRGCSVEDIVNCVAITAVQTQINYGER